MSALLMVAHPKGWPYITNDPEVADSLQIEEEMKHQGPFLIGSDMVTEVGESIRNRLVVDFGGGIMAGWGQETVELLDGSEFVFWPHQFSGVLKELRKAFEQAQTQGYGILQDELFPVALNLNDLSFLLGFFVEVQGCYLEQEKSQKGQYLASCKSRLHREGMMLLSSDHILLQDPSTKIVPSVPGPKEIQ